MSGAVSLARRLDGAWHRLNRPGFWLGAGLMLALGAIVLAPLLNILAVTFTGRGIVVWEEVLFGRLSRNLFWVPLGNTLTVGLLVALGTTLIGGVLAWLVVFTDMPGRRLIGTMAAVPFMIPSFATALAWGVLFRNDRVGGWTGLFHQWGVAVPDELSWGFIPIVIVLVSHYYAISFLMIAAALASVNADLIEAAEMARARRLRVMLGITLPMVLPAIMASAALTFASGASNFAAPALLGLPVRFHTLATRLYGMIEIGQVERGYALAILLIVATAVFLWFGNRVISGRRSFATLTGKGSRTKRTALGPWRWPAFGIAIAVCVATTVVPTGALILSSLSAEGIAAGEFTLHFWIGASDPAIAQAQPGILRDAYVIRAATTTIAMGVVVGIVATVVGIAVAYFISRHQHTWIAGVIRQLAFLPILLPGIALGAAYIALFGAPIGPLPALYGTFVLLVIAGAAYTLPFATQSGSAAIAQVSGELEDSARMTKAGFTRRLAAILIPLMNRGLLVGSLLVFLKIVRDLSLVVLLSSPATPLLSVVAFRYAADGFYQYAHAITVLILAISVVAALLARRLQGASQPWLKNA